MKFSPYLLIGLVILILIAIFISGMGCTYYINDKIVSKEKFNKLKKTNKSNCRARFAHCEC